LKSLPALFALPLLWLWGSPALADGLDSGDTAWVLTATVLVLMMTLPGVALLYAGMVRKKFFLR